jgi:hypothetical protein
MSHKNIEKVPRIRWIRHLVAKMSNIDIAISNRLRNAIRNQHQQKAPPSVHQNKYIFWGIYTVL